MGAKKIDELIDGFINRLEQRNLIIVEKKPNLENIQKEFLQKDALKPSEIVQSELLPYKTANGIKKFKGFKHGEKYRNSKGEWMIATSAVVRLRKKMQIV